MKLYTFIFFILAAQISFGSEHSHNKAQNHLVLSIEQYLKHYRAAHAKFALKHANYCMHSNSKPDICEQARFLDEQFKRTQKTGNFKKENPTPEHIDYLWFRYDLIRQCTIKLQEMDLQLHRELELSSGNKTAETIVTTTQIRRTPTPTTPKNTR